MTAAKIVNDWNEFDFTRSIFFNCSDEINKLIMPINKYFNLDSFVFLKSYPDGSEIRLTNQPQWQEYYFRKKLYLKNIFENHPDNYSKSKILWSTINTSRHNFILAEARKFGIQYGITCIEPTADGCEFYFLGTTKGTYQIMHHYLSNLELIQKFIQYFQNKGAKLINTAYQERIIIPDRFRSPKHKKLSQIEKYQFINELSDYNFTSRELECIRGLIMGQTAKLIAQKLNISYRTIETHIEHIKNKAKVSNKAELIEMLIQMFT